MHNVKCSAQCCERSFFTFQFESGVAGVTFQTPTPLLFQNFWIWVRLFFKFENPTLVQTPATTIDPNVIYPCFYQKNDRTDSCYCWNGKVTRSRSGFSQIFWSFAQQSFARVSYIMVLFFTHIPFVVTHIINATPPERLQQNQTKDDHYPIQFAGRISGTSDATPSVFLLDLVFFISSSVLVFFYGYLEFLYEWAECN